MESRLYLRLWGLNFFLRGGGGGNGLSFGGYYNPNFVIYPNSTKAFSDSMKGPII